MPHLAAAPGAYGLVGMGAVFAATARAPITAVIIIFELTGDYRMILPLMLAIVVATTLSNAITHDTIYTLKLRRRGIDIDEPPPGPMAQTTIAEAMGPLPRPLGPEQPLAEVLARFTSERAETLPVIDAHGTLLGVVAAIDVEHALAHSADGLRAGSLLHSTPDLHAEQPLQDAVRALAATEDGGLPILDGADEVSAGSPIVASCARPANTSPATGERHWPRPRGDATLGRARARRTGMVARPRLFVLCPIPLRPTREGSPLKKASPNSPSADQHASTGPGQPHCGTPRNGLVARSSANGHGAHRERELRSRRAA